MRGIYEIVSLCTSLEDVSFIFQRHNGYFGLNTHHKLLMRYIHMMDVISAYIHFSLSYINDVYDRYKNI